MRSLVCGMGRLAGVLLFVTALALPAAYAHETRPAYLQMKETAPGEFSVLWHTPVLAGMRLPLKLTMPEGVRNVKEPVIQDLTDRLIERRWIDAGPNGLDGKRIKIAGLQLTITDVLVRIEFADGRTLQTIVRPVQPWIEIDPSQTWWQVMGTYLVEGIRHILLGVDHLLFVLGLLLIVANRWMLLKTITSFTIAHSITLAIATLGHASAPVPPLNAAIALSILFLGPEIVRRWRGQTSFTIRHPWVVAFAFGLLHGFYLAVNQVWRTVRKHRDRRLGRKRGQSKWWGRSAAILLTFACWLVGLALFRAANMTDAIMILKGMFGFNGFALPGMLLARLGDVGPWLAAHGVEFSEGRGLVRGGLVNWMIILLAIAWFAPNTQQIMAQFRPALVLPRDSQPARLLLWRPGAVSAAIAAAVAFAAIVNLHRNSEFLYFQF